MNKGLDVDEKNDISKLDNSLRLIVYEFFYHLINTDGFSFIPQVAITLIELF